VVVPKNVSRATIALARVLSALAPTIGLMALDAEGVSRDQAVVRAYIDDPLVYTGKTTARLGYEMIRAMQRVTAGASRITLPMIILQGGADRLVDPNGARMLYDTIGSSDKRIKVYDNLYHEVYNEPERDQVLGDVEAWLEEHLNIAQ
jgi:alpha-beta hydrolase superfamily lysophospholipase